MSKKKFHLSRFQGQNIHEAFLFLAIQDYILLKEFNSDNSPNIDWYMAEAVLLGKYSRTLTYFDRNTGEKVTYDKDEVYISYFGLTTQELIDTIGYTDSFWKRVKKQVFKLATEYQEGNEMENTPEVFILKQEVCDKLETDRFAYKEDYELRNTLTGIVPLLVIMIDRSKLINPSEEETFVTLDAEGELVEMDKEELIKQELIDTEAKYYQVKNPHFHKAFSQFPFIKAEYVDLYLQKIDPEDAYIYSF